MSRPLHNRTTEQDGLCVQYNSLNSYLGDPRTETIRVNEVMWYLTALIAQFMSDFDDSGSRFRESFLYASQMVK